MKKDQTSPKQVKEDKDIIVASAKPLMQSIGSYSSQTKTRSNRSGSIERTDRFKNIEDGLVPFNYGNAQQKGNSNINIRDTVILCQKAYYNFSVFRNTIDLMTEFSSSKLYLRGGSQKSRDFFSALFEKINLWGLQDKFFREYYRSGNVFVYRYDAKVDKADINKMAQTFGVSGVSESFEIPARYVILNPADIQVGGNISFANSQYFKVLSGYELERLRNPKTKEDEEVLNSFDEETRRKITSRVPNVAILLKPEKINAIFYKKMDYEPFAVPMGYPVLDDINWKAEMKKMDMAIARTMQQAILLITMGAEPEKGGINQNNLEHMQTLFANESVGRVLIADYTTKGQFIVPDIGNILDPKKYDIVNRDIENGLLSVISGGEKFANQNIKIELFMAKLKQAREMFLNQFLIPEIKRIAKDLGFKNYPIPYFHKLSLRNNDIMSRIYSRLVEVGVLTPDEGIEALETGKLPSPEESLLSQEDYRKVRDKGFYEPITGGPSTQFELLDKNLKTQEELQKNTLKSQEKIGTEKLNSPQNVPSGQVPQAKPEGEKGRPGGTSSPQTTKNITPIGGSQTYLTSLVKDNFFKAEKVYKKVESLLKKKHSLEELNDQQKNIALEITKTVIANESLENWEKSAADYVKNPVDTNPDRIKQIQEIAYEHQIDDYLASILYVSKSK